MLTSQDFILLYIRELNLIKIQTDGLTQADTLIQPQPSGNCMNWVLGHLLEYQINLLELLGGEAPAEVPDVSRYRRESNPIKADGPDVLSLDSLLAGHEAVHARVAARLADLTDAEFAGEIQIGERKMTLGYRVLFLFFHYTYHVGQLELLRQMAGKTEKLV